MDLQCWSNYIWSNKQIKLLTATLETWNVIREEETFQSVGSYKIGNEFEIEQMKGSAMPQNGEWFVCVYVWERDSCSLKQEKAKRKDKMLCNIE